MDMEQLRERLGLNPMEVALRLNKSLNTVRNWEMGRATPTLTPAEFLEALDVYQCSPKELAEAVQQSQGKQKRKAGRRPKKRSDRQ